MKKRILAMVLALTMAGTMMAGCGSSGDDAAAENDNAAAEETTAEETEETAEAENADASTEEASEEPVELYVFIAASLSNAMEELKTAYQEEHPNVDIKYNVDSSGTLQTQIEEGAQCDIFFSAALQQMDALVEGGYVDQGNVANLLENKVVLIKPTGGETTVTGFSDITNAANLALAGEDVPVGQYARKIFDNLGITDQVMAMEINEGANVTAVLTAVAEHSNEVGIVYSTDAASMPDDVEVIAEATEEEVGEAVVYPVGLVKDEQATEAQTEAAKDFYEYLQSDDAAAVFEEYGFAVNQ
ncbi:MAG: molybdate ABC transporter substrate-binding protein [Ruminococcus sp.]|jgi:molybdate transport system substrate-binding protein